MTKKDYQAIARTMYQSRELAETTGGEETWDWIRADLANTFAADNSRFNRALFFEACETGKCRGMKGEPS